MRSVRQRILLSLGIACVLTLTFSQAAHPYGNCNIYIQTDGAVYLPVMDALTIAGQNAKRDLGVAWGFGFIGPIKSDEDVVPDQAIIIGFNAAYSKLNGDFDGVSSNRKATTWAVSVRYSKQWKPLSACPGPGASRFSANIGPALIGHTGKAYRHLDGLTTVGVMSGVSLGIGRSGRLQIFADALIYALRLENQDDIGKYRALVDFVIGLRIHSNALD